MTSQAESSWLLASQQLLMRLTSPVKEETQNPKLKRLPQNMTKF